ncbi:transposase [Natrialba chahannaoensis JCM 10990]|uniref:Transposase n=1 Tax=Natrialba chahannaoensis JCM 10990 TaxID=1227492 RepID=M0AH98_9EURY|nr:transposase [Natrialba chahannaoensis JCM 10990]
MIATTLYSSKAFHAERPATVLSSAGRGYEKQIGIDGEKKWLYAVINIDPRLLLEIAVYSRCGTESAAAFLHRLIEKHDIDEIEFLADSGAYLTSFAHHELSGQLNYNNRNHVENGPISS